MASVKYNGDVVNSSVNNLKSISEKFPSLVDGIQRATNQIISARGFSEYVGSISGDAFSGMVQGCQSNCDNVINAIRQKQVDILAYNNDKDGINTFLDQLDRSDYDKLNLSSIDKYITLDRKAFNVLNGAWSSVQLFGLGLVEGLGEFGETGMDLLDMGQTAFKSLYTKKDQLDELWAGTRARVSEEHVKSLFDSIYSDNEHLRNLKYNAYGGESGREIGKGLGYAAGMIGLTAATGGIGGAGAGVAGFGANAAQLGVTAGLMGVSKHTEEAWNSGAETFKGLRYGAAAGAWEGVQWYFGAKINALGGERVAGELIRGGNSMAAARIGLSGVDAAAEGYVQPALSMIYKDYGQGNLIDNYKVAYDQAGGAANVFKNATMGVIGGTIGELVELRQGLKSRKAVTGPNVAEVGSAEVVAKQKAIDAFRKKYPEIVKQYGDDFVETIPVSEIERLVVDERAVSRDVAAKMLGVDRVDTSFEFLSGNKNDIADFLSRNGYASADVDGMAEKMAAEIFASKNVAKLRTNSLAMSGNLDDALKLAHSTGNLNDLAFSPNSIVLVESAATDIFRSLETYATSQDTKKFCIDLCQHFVNMGYDIPTAGSYISRIYETATRSRGFEVSIINVDGRDIFIKHPIDLRSSSSNMSVKQFAEYISNLPDEIRGYAPDDIIFHDSFCIDDILDSTKEGVMPSMDGPSTLGYNYSADNHIEIFASTSSNDVKETIVHEIGHSFDKAKTGILADFSSDPAWIQAAQNDIRATGNEYVSSYAKWYANRSTTSASYKYLEDFAEAVSYYFTRHDQFVRDFPNRARLLEQWLRDYSRV